MKPVVSMPSQPRPRWLRRSGRAALAVVAAVCSLAAHAATLISNLPPATNGGSEVNSTLWKALVFTTGASTSSIDQVVLGLNPFNPGSVPSQAKVEIALYATAAGTPSTQIRTTGLLSVDIQQLQGSYAFPLGAGFTLAANTQYALVVRSDASAIRWSNTAGTQPTASSGFTYNTFVLSNNAGFSWTSAGVGMLNAVQLQGTQPAPARVPALSTWAMLALGLLIAAAGARAHRRARG
jgi:hypothetical protein